MRRRDATGRRKQHVDVLGGDEAVLELPEEELHRVADGEDGVLPEVVKRPGVVARANFVDVRATAALAEDAGGCDEGGVYR